MARNYLKKSLTHAASRRHAPIGNGDASSNKQWIVMEFHGKGDPMFGGAADDRILGKNGFFLTGVHSRDDYGTFGSETAALRAAEDAPNRRLKGLLLTLPK